MGLVAQSEYETSIVVAVHGSRGTDRNCATVGSFCDIIPGVDKLPEKWAVMSKSHLYSIARGFSKYMVSNLANSSREIVRELIAGAR